MAKDSSKAISSINSILRGVAGMYPKMDRHVSCLPLWKNWPDIVGREIADVSWPYCLRSDACDVLVIWVLDSMWMQQLQFNKMTILEKIEAALHSDVIKDIKFCLGDVSALRAEWEYRRKFRKQSSSRPKIHLTPEEQAMFDEIGDTDLRNSLIRLYLRHKETGSDFGHQRG